MSEKTCGTLLLMIFAGALYALGLMAPSSHDCARGSVEALFTSCERVASR